ncbi:hypothetical protein CE91St54_53510 [Hungatella hathewayi]|uniref:Uncharacterized protein n=1 Tax=Hungatella hathewayi TaxID=154046 RepID=A0AA37JGG4_9FIRM|nr:hypothetical protein CE91St55_27490 [Hungatella hathewayi]GKH10243.1 hypothetical protein CE91St54_53510 [Hungatella hathewayi]
MLAILPSSVSPNTANRQFLAVIGPGTQPLSYADVYVDRLENIRFRDFDFIYQF